MWRRGLLALAISAAGCGWDWEPTRSLAADGGTDTFADIADDVDAEDETSVDATTDGDAASDAIGDASCAPTVDLNSDPKNCGKCGNVCRDGYGCISKICGNAVSQLAAGRAHTCALRRDGSVDCWGANDRGQLGNGTYDSKTAPVKVTGLPGKPSQIAAGGDHTCARIGDKVWCWGNDGNGELGDGTPGGSSTKPVAVTGLSGATSVIAGGTFTCAMQSSGHALCWGANDKGQLGDTTTTPRSKPGAEVGGSDGIAFLGISGGPSHACGRRSSGGIAVWGDNATSQSGFASPSTQATFPTPTIGLPTDPAAMSFVTDASGIAAGGGHCCASRAAGIVICWGANDRGQLGNGLVEPGPGRKDFVEVGALPAVSPATLVAGGEHTCARASTGSVYCWGRNDVGQLGRGTSGADQPTAATVDLKNVVELVAGGEHTCARDSGGAVWCWGANDRGQLGDHSKTNRNKPVPLPDVP
ncbi:MAG: RCC1 domain-containing protein [Polyangiales bacterium]